MDFYEYCEIFHIISRTFSVQTRLWRYPRSTQSHRRPNLWPPTTKPHTRLYRYGPLRAFANLTAPTAASASRARDSRPSLSQNSDARCLASGSTERDHDMNWRTEEGKALRINVFSHHETSETDASIAALYEPPAAPQDTPALDHPSPTPELDAANMPQVNDNSTAAPAVPPTFKAASSLIRPEHVQRLV